MDNGIGKIHKFLIDNGWNDLGYGDYLSKDYKFKIGVYYNSESGNYTVRSAILTWYDRWANSGSEEDLNTEDDVIKFFKGRYIVSALEEIMSTVEDGLSEDGDMNEETYKLVCDILDAVEEK